MEPFNQSVIKQLKTTAVFVAKLKKANILTTYDFIYHFPSRYADYSQIKKIIELKADETVTVKGTLLDAKNIYTKYGKKLTQATVTDNDTAKELPIIWFNQHYIKTMLHNGSNYYFSGRTGLFNNKLHLIAPEFEEANENRIHTGRLVPIYPEVAGLTSKWIRTKIHMVLTQLNESNEFFEFLPKALLEKYSLLDWQQAINQIHFPNVTQDANTARQRFAFEELFLELLNVELRKKAWGDNFISYSVKNNDTKLQEFINSLPFKLTKSQERAVQEINKKMSATIPMNHLLEGDVGSGKTIVALLAAYTAFLNGYKTIYMAPTEILATQHYETFKNFLANVGIKIELKTGATKAVANNIGWDIIIGTHALLYNFKSPEKVALVIIDEQHRFGVEQRAKLLRQLEQNHKPHLLTMTATPIPRTLALTVYGDLSLSVLSETPNKDKKITTRVIPLKLKDSIYNWIKNQGASTFIVCPLIEESQAESLENVKAAEVEYKNLKKTHFKDTTIGLLHGRMKPNEKQEIINKFRNGEIKVLVATPVIEVGIDIPEATIMVIESAERYGLASLHQLRGRVGRGNKEGFCFIFMSNNSRNAYSRLKNLEIISNGLLLAEKDMELRGHGDIYGTQQHGFKKLKIADLSDIKTLENAKHEAEIIFPQLDQYPTLKAKIAIETKLVENN